MKFPFLIFFPEVAWLNLKVAWKNLTRHDVTLCLMWITIHQKSVDKCRQSPIDNRSIIDQLSINNELIRSSAVYRQRGVNGSRRPSMGPLHPPACSLVPPPRLGGSGLILHTCAARMAPRANRPARPPLSTGLALFPLFCFFAASLRGETNLVQTILPS